MNILLCKMYYVIVLVLLSVHISFQSAYITTMTASIPGETDIMANSVGNDDLVIAGEHNGTDAVDQISSVETIGDSIASIDKIVRKIRSGGPKVVASNYKVSSTNTRHQHVFIGRSTTHVPVMGILTLIVFTCWGINYCWKKIFIICRFDDNPHTIMY